MNLEWNQFTSFIGGDFLSLITDNYNIKFHLPKPGGKLIDNKLFLKSQFPGLIIRYTIDGSIPSVDSKIYTGPVILEKYDYILARSFDHSGRGGLTIKIKQNGNN